MGNEFLRRAVHVKMALNELDDQLNVWIVSPYCDLTGRIKKFTLHLSPVFQVDSDLFL